MKRPAVGGNWTQGTWLVQPVLCHWAYDNWTTTSPHNSLHALHRWYWNASVTHLAATQYLHWEKPLSMGSLLMKRIFRSTPNGVLMAHAEWLPGVWLRHFSTICAVHIEDCEGWWLSGCHRLSGRALAAQARGVLVLIPGDCQPFHFPLFSPLNI